jgi:hypothetical protein
VKRARLVELLDEFSEEAFAEGQISLSDFIYNIATAVKHLED